MLLLANIFIKTLYEWFPIDESTMTERGIDELRRAGLFDEDADYEGETGKAVEALLRVFSEQGHSGFSASLASTLFYKLCKGEVLSPLTTDISEWMDVSEVYGQDNAHPDMAYQSNRCPNIFTTVEGLKDSKAYTLDGIVWKDPDGFTYTDKNSKVWFDLPGYPPETLYKDAPKNESFKEDVVGVIVEYKYGAPFLLRERRI